MKRAYKHFRRLNDKSNKQSFLEIYDSNNTANPNHKPDTVNQDQIPFYKQAPSDFVNYGEGNVSIQGAKLVAINQKLVRAILLKKTIGYVYDDNFVVLKPRWCQFKDDIQLLKSLGFKF